MINVEIICTPFGQTADGQSVEQYTLTDGACRADILTLGGIIRTLIVPDQHGVPIDVVLGFDSVRAYEAQSCYIGALLGRCAGRIAAGCIAITGQEYHLSCNEKGINHLHGGCVGLDKRIWRAKVEADRLLLHYDSPAGEEGYPGNLSVTVAYSLRDGSLALDYSAKADADTVCNLSSHAYFNLAGHDAGEVGEQLLCVHAGRYTPLGAYSAPDGTIASVNGTPLDLRIPRPMADGWDSGFDQIRRAGGYDHNYIIEGEGMRPVDVVYCVQTGIQLTLRSDMPGVQVYSGNSIGSDLPRGKGGAVYGKRHGFCLETQFWPNAFACPGFPLPILRVGEIWHHRTEYVFSTR